MAVTEIVPDEEALRAERRQRALQEMEAADVDVLVLGREANARYVSGAPRLWTAGSRAFGPGCVVVRSTGAVHLLSTWDQGVPDEIPHEHLYGISFNAMTFLEVLKAIDPSHTARTVATDGWAPSSQWLLSTAFPNASIVDGEQLLARARRTKTALELDAIRHSVRVAEQALGSAEAAVAPGVTGRQLTGVFMEAMAAQGVTTPAGQDVAWITSPDDPARRQGRDRPARDGDLVAFEAGVVVGGYSGELCRTVGVGGDVSAPLRERAAALWDSLLDACRPGVPAAALLDAYAAAGEPLPPMPVARGLGLGFDLPLVTGALPGTAAAEVLEPGMAFLLTAFVWQEGAGAVVTADPVAVTTDGAEVLSSHPTRVARSG